MRMSSVCVSCGLPSTGGSFLPPLPGFALFLSFVVRRLGVSYFTKLWSGGPGMALRPLVSSLQRRNGGLEKCRLLRRRTPVFVSPAECMPPKRVAPRAWAAA